MGGSKIARLLFIVYFSRETLHLKESRVSTYLKPIGVQYAADSREDGAWKKF